MVRRPRFTSGGLHVRIHLFATALILLAISGSAFANADQSNEEAQVASENPAITAPVTVDGRVLFRVRGVTAFPAELRAQMIADQIRAVAANRSIAADSLRLVDAQYSTDIYAGDRHLVSVFDVDTRVEGEGLVRRMLAAVYRKRIEAAILEYRAEREPRALLRDALLAVACVFILALTLVVITRVSRLVARGLERRYQSAVERIERGSSRLISAASIWKAVHGASALITLFVALALVLLDLQFVLGLFPWTRGFSVEFEGIALTPLLRLSATLIRTVPKLMVVLLIVAAARYVLRLVRLLFDEIKQGTLKVSGFDPEWSDSTYNIVRVLLIAFTVVVCYPFIPGSESQAFKGVTIFIGVLFSLGSSSFLANVIAGYTMTYRRAFRIGDRIQVGDTLGDVIQIGLLATYLRSIRNEELVVPNSLVLTDNVTNYSSLARRGGLILHTTVGIGYEVPWRQVEAMLLIAAERTPGLLREPRPFVWQRALADYSVTYELNVYCDDPIAMYGLYTELHRNILDVFNEYNIQIMTPSYMADPAQPKVVTRDHWFAKPAPSEVSPAGNRK